MRARLAFPILALTLLAWATPRPVRAQAPTRADSAAILLSAAQRLAVEGQREAAQAVRAYVLRHFGDTPSAAVARAEMRSQPTENEGGGRVELVAWGTLFGAWMGIVVPGALGVEDQPEIYGLGLLAGGPLGYLGAQRLAASRRVTLGEARAMTFGFRWGTSQALWWLLELTDDPSQEAVFTTMGLGGVGGMLLGGAIAHRRNLTAGQVAFTAQGYYWGTYFAATLAAIADVEEHSGRYVLAGADIAMLAAAAVAPRDITAGQVWLISATGIAGMLAGWGIDLIVNPDGDDVILGIPMVTSAIGLMLGAKSARAEGRRGGETPGASAVALPGALLDRTGSRLRVGMPLPAPTLVPVGERGPRRLYRPALSVPLFRASF